MKKIKNQKGITLIALIITIVVLLILAAVTISSIQNDGILGHAQGAAGEYNNAQNDEKVTLNTYEGVIKNQVDEENVEEDSNVEGETEEDTTNTEDDDSNMDPDGWTRP